MHLLYAVSGFMMIHIVWTLLLFGCLSRPVITALEPKHSEESSKETLGIEKARSQESPDAMGKESDNDTLGDSKGSQLRGDWFGTIYGD